TVVQTRRDLAGPTPGAESAVPGLPAATLAALANYNAANSTNLKVVWNEPSFSNPGFSGNNGTPVIDAAGNVQFFGQAAATSYLDPDTLSTVWVIGGAGGSFGGTSSNNSSLYRASIVGTNPNGSPIYGSPAIFARSGSTASPVTVTTNSDSLLGGPTP